MANAFAKTVKSEKNANAMIEARLHMTIHHASLQIQPTRYAPAWGNVNAEFVNAGNRKIPAKKSPAAIANAIISPAKNKTVYYALVMENVTVKNVPAIRGGPENHVIVL